MSIDRTDMVNRVNIEQDVIERLTEMALIDSVVVVMSEEWERKIKLSMTYEEL